MKRGEVWWTEFDPAVGGEIRKQRPAVIVSNDIANRILNRVQIVPLTTSVGHVYPSEAVIMLRGKRQKALADQIQTADKSRLQNRIGRVTPPEMRDIEIALQIQLGLMQVE